MINGKRVLALIPARGGSKGLPNKNILPLLGKPLLAWSIEQAKDCRYVDCVIVSTDDEKIASAAKKYGAEVPFMRPAALASDTASSIDVVIHALDHCEQGGRKFDILLLLEPTSPLRESKDLNLALEKLVGSAGAESVVGVAKTESAHPQFLMTVEGGFLKPFIDGKVESTRRQDLSDVYFFEGSVYAAFSDSLRKCRTFYHEKTLPYVVDRYKSYEVDEMSDLIVIEALLAARQRGVNL